MTLFFLVISQAFHHSLWLYIISIKHRYQTITCNGPSKIILFVQGLFSLEKSASIPQTALTNK